VLTVTVPGFGTLRIEHLVLDYNGTLALDGELLPGVKLRLRRLSRRLRLHVLTADTFGSARAALSGVPCSLSILSPRRQDRAKRDYVARLGSPCTACIGNGRNDRMMLKSAALGIVVLQKEGAAATAIAAADLVVPTITEALDLLDRPLRLIASLRS